MYGDSLHKLEQIVVKALIKAPLKNNYNPQRRLVQSEKNYFGPLGVPCLDRCLQIRVQLRPFQSELQWPSYSRLR